MDPIKADPRVVRTRRLLVEALIGLCSESGYAAVSVADVARRAGVNRATFYLHFEGKDDLLERGLDTLFDELGSGFESRPAGLDDEAWARARMTAFFRLLEERRPFFQAMLSGGGASTLMDRARAFLERFMLEKRGAYMAAGPSGAAPELVARIVVSVLLGVAGYGLSRPGAASPEAMADLYIRFMRGGLVALGIGEIPAGLGAGSAGSGPKPAREAANARGLKTKSAPRPASPDRRRR